MLTLLKSYERTSHPIKQFNSLTSTLVFSRSLSCHRSGQYCICCISSQIQTTVTKIHLDPKILGSTRDFQLRIMARAWQHIRMSRITGT